jgi:hypothetical protein
MNTQQDFLDAAADAVALYEQSVDLELDLRQAKAALRAIYGHVTNGNLEWPAILQLVEETCCTALNDYERMQALCEYEGGDE